MGAGLVLLRSSAAVLATALLVAPSPAAGGDPAAPLANPVLFVGQPPVDLGPTESGTYPRYRGFGAPIVRVTGANLFRLDPSGAVTNLTKRTNAAIRNPDVSFDGQRVLYAMALAQDGRWQVHEMNVDGTGDRRVSLDWNFNDLDPAYLPDGRIVFTSDRRKVVDPYLGLPSAQLHVMNADGTGVTQLSSDPGGEFAPSVTSTGEVSFIRWDVKIAHGDVQDPLDVSRFLLWKMNPDGTNNGHPAFGPHSVRDFSGGYFQAREIQDGTGRFLATTTHDFYFLAAGALVRLDPAGDQDGHRPEFLDRGFDGVWRDPYPTADGRILASWAQTSFSAVGVTGGAATTDFALVVTDADGRGRRVLHQDANLWSWEPVEVAARPVPPVIPSTLDRSKDWGILNSRDVTLRGVNPWVAEPDVQGGVPDQPGLKARIYRSKRVGTGVWYGYGEVGYASVEQTLLGEAPVAADGSFAARVPANTPITWEIVDAAGAVLVKERFWNQVLPGQVQTCNGCHSPHDGRTGRTTNLALAAPKVLGPADPLAAEAAAALDAAHVAVGKARDLYTETAASAAVSERVVSRLARAERALVRGDLGLASGDFASVLRVSRRAETLASYVLKRLRA